jgi:hypothetical protein
VLRRYRDGSFLSQIGTVKIRVIECETTTGRSDKATLSISILAAPGPRHSRPGC